MTALSDLIAKDSLCLAFGSEQLPDQRATPHPVQNQSALRVLDLFSGAAGGWSLGLHRAGFVTVAACEADPWRREQYARNFPGVRMYDDVRTLTADQLAADGIVPDIIVGSPPCQDASGANTKGRGVDGERTGLFFDALRLVRELRPAWCAFENSPRLRTRGVDRLLGELEADDYAAWPIVVRASDFGANHERARLVILAHARDANQVNRARAYNGPLGSIQGGTHPGPAGVLARAGHASDADRDAVRIEPRRCGRSLGPCAPIAVVDHAADPAQVGREGLARQERQPGTEAKSRPIQHWSAASPDFGRVDDGLSDKVARACISAYGDAFIPQAAEIVGRAIIHAERTMQVAA